MTDTQELLGKFVSHGSEAAFRELVTRYFDLVYSTAVRLVGGDTYTAEDVAQVVFSDLARTVGKLSDRTTLGGWLHRHTCFVARTVMRGERRRKAREKKAVEMNALNSEGVSLLAQVAPTLDEAINELGADDRDAILLRFFEQRNLRSVGEALGMTENAAQKRVARALHELGMLLQRHGVTVTLAALASGLASEAVTAAPTGLALTVAGAVLADVGASGSLGLAAAKAATWAKLKIGIAAALVVVAVVSVILLKRQTGDEGRSDTPSQRQLVQQQVGNSLVPDDTVGRGTGGTDSVSPVREQPPQAIAQPQAGAGATELPRRPIAAIPQLRPPVSAVSGTVRLYGRSGSKLRIEGTSNIHDWQVESSLIGGFIDIAPGFPLELGAAMKPGPVWAQVDSFVPVRSLKSVDRDGRPYSDKMDEVMRESLRAERYPRIRYSLFEMSMEGATNHGDATEFEFSSRGELSIAGVTNEVSMPVFVLPMGAGKLKISGSMTIKVSSFQIKPPAPKLPLGMFKTGDDITITFSWTGGPSSI